MLCVISQTCYLTRHSLHLHMLHLLCRQRKDWATLRRPLSKFMLTSNVIQNFVPDFNSISKDLVGYVRSHKDNHTGNMVLNDSAASFFKVTYECELVVQVGLTSLQFSL